MAFLDLFWNREPRGVYGLLAEYDSPDTLIEACKRVRDAGYRRTDAFTPFPVHGMEAALGLPDSNVGKIAIFFSFTGAMIALLMQWWTGAVGYPLVVGGKPFFAFEPSIPITFELTVLLSAFSSVAIMFFLNGLPRFNHPVFGAKVMERVGDDRFVLLIERADPKFSAEETKRLLESTHPLRTELLEVRD
jgi:hypothetical protein